MLSFQHILRGRSAFYQWARFEVRQKRFCSVLLGPLSLKCATTDATNALIIQLNGAPSRLRKVDFPSLSLSLWCAAKSSQEFPSHFTNSKWPPLSARTISPLIRHTKVAIARHSFDKNFTSEHVICNFVSSFSWNLFARLLKMKGLKVRAEFLVNITV
jgi:hypothetical protein